MSWTPRNTPVFSGTEPYDWDSASLHECTWYAYYRVQEGSRLDEPPCWYSGSGSSGYGLYTNAKEWLNHYRTPWRAVPYRSGYQCKVGDIVVFTGQYGHVVVVEKVNRDGTLCVSDYNLIGGSHVFGYKTDYVYGDRIIGASIGTGDCIGVLTNANISGGGASAYATFLRKLRRKKRRYQNYVKL